MKNLLRRSAALAAALAASAVALAHPGHAAPPAHAHDSGEALVMAAAILVIAVIAAGIAAARLAKARTKERP